MIDLLYAETETAENLPVHFGIQTLDTDGLFQMLIESTCITDLRSEWLVNLFSSNPETILLRQTCFKQLDAHPEINNLLEQLYIQIVKWQGNIHFARKYNDDFFLDKLGEYNTILESLESVVQLTDQFETVLQSTEAKNSTVLCGLVAYLQRTVEQMKLLTMLQRSRHDLSGAEQPGLLTVGLNLDENFRVNGYKVLTLQKKGSLHKKTKKGSTSLSLDNIQDLQDYASATAFVAGTISEFAILKNMLNVLKEWGIFYNRSTFFSSGSQQVGVISVSEYSGVHSEERIQKVFNEIVKQAADDTQAIVLGVQRSLLSQFVSLRDVLAFYISGFHFMEKLKESGLSFCFPSIASEHSFTAKGLYLPLLFHSGLPANKIIGNDVAIADGQMCIVTGANQGGKTTFLKSVALAQLMFQLGLPVCSENAEIGICNNMVSIFAGSEDQSSPTGRLKQELDTIAEAFKATNSGNTFIVLNEPLTSTGEDDALTICQSLLRKMLEKHMRGIFVTHLHKLAEEAENIPGCKNLIAGYEDGELTYKVVEGKPELSSHAYEAAERKGIRF